MNRITSAAAKAVTGTSLRTRVVAAVAALGLAGTMSAMGTISAFSGTTANAGSTFASGTVTITDNDANGTMFTMSGMKPGDTDAKCITVTYTGSLPSTVRLYGTTSGTGLDTYLNVTVTRGTMGATPSAYPTCTTFAADATTYITGQAAGVGLRLT